MKRELIGVIMQAFYGNRTYTELVEDDIDLVLQGVLNGQNALMDFEPDRTVIKLPDSKCVLVYNKHQEAAQLERCKEWALKDGYVAKPLATVPEQNLEIFSRCFICRMNELGKFESIQSEDRNVVCKYLAM